MREAHVAALNYPALRWVGPFLLDAYARTGNRDESARLIPEIVAEDRRSHPQGSPEVSASQAGCSLMLPRIEKFADAEVLLREAFEIREKIQSDAWVTFNTMSLLGGALLGRKRYAESEPLLLKGYEGLDLRKSAISPEARDRLPEAIDRLVELYESTGRPDDVKKWESVRSKL